LDSSDFEGIVPILIASKNPGKIREFRELLADEGIEFTDLSKHHELADVEETGATFHENAALKASEYAKALGIWALADDSGLEVDALEGKPGVHSARWAAINRAGKGDAANNSLLLSQLKNLPDEKRAARFVCVLALSDPTGQIVLTATDKVEGKILREMRGGGGFGYDPLFFVEELGQTTGEMSAEAKHRISHRGKALRQLAKMMKTAEFRKVFAASARDSE
jgi:XTP/dITP diphosphohydrolase